MLRYVKRGAENQQAIGQLPGWLSSILRNRGVDTPEKAERFLHPSLEQLHDPLAMEGMAKAVEILHRAIAEQTPIQIYGDYDCDGVCATAIMMETLTELGAVVDYRIPSRHGEGYGLNCDAVREIAKEHKVLLTVDCGVTNHEEVRLAQLLGMTVIVTDHHQLADTPSPADVVLNPLCGEYPFRRLCGAGVALKLTQALSGMEAVMRRIELAALATVADIVPLIDENRVIVREGLARLADCGRPGLKALMTLANVTPPVSAGAVGYRLAPRINAGGRMEDAAQCVAMLISRDAAEAERIAAHLEKSNEQRQTLQLQITQQAEQLLTETIDFYDDQVIVVMGEGWNSGVIGLAAGKLCEKYHYPTIVLSRQDDVAVGSCRSIPGVNIHAMLSTCQDLFMRFGGHEQAAGLTMRADLVPELRRRLNLAIRANCDPACYIPAREYDAAIRLEQVDLTLIEQLDALQPTGYGNPAPVFLTCGAHLQEARPVGKTGEHLKLSLLDGAAMRDGIAFGLASAAREGLECVDVLFAPDRNEFRGRVSAQMQVQAIRPASGTAPLPPQQRLFEGFLQEIALLAANDLQIPADAVPITEAQAMRLAETGRGTLLIGHERERAMKLAVQTGADVLTGEVADRRGFSTVLCAPQLDGLRDVWHDIVLLDGDVLPGEAAMIRAKCPRARLHAMKPNPLFTALADSAALDRNALAAVYRLLKTPNLSAAWLAEQTQLSVMQVLTALTAFGETGLAAFSLSPFAVRLLPQTPGAKKDMMNDSPTLRYLHGRK